MTERSRPWDGTTTGDATEAPYDAPSEFARILRGLSPAAEQSAHKGGVVNGAAGYNALAATSPSANTGRIASGIAFNQGTWYENDANVDFTIPTPAASTRIDRVVLRKNWVAQTVRLTRIAGTEGAGAPAMTQVFGTTWDVPVAQFSITTGGVITVIDDRVYILVPAHDHTSASNGGQFPHTSLTTVTADQHHAQLHAAAHHSGGGDQMSHQSIVGAGSNTHANIDTHIAAQIATVHGITVINSTGNVSMGAPTNGKMVFARANGGTLNVSTTSGSIVRRLESPIASLAITNGDSNTLIADGVNWYVYD